MRSEERRKSRQSRGRKIRRKFGELFAAFAGREVVSRGGEEKGNSAETEEEEEDDNRRYLGFGRSRRWRIEKKERETGGRAQEHAKNKKHNFPNN